MSAIEETAEVGVPLSVARNQWTQFQSFSRFMTVVQQVEQVTPTISRWSVGRGPLGTAYEAEIIDQRPDTCVSWRSLDGPRHRGEVTFTALTADRTAVTVRMRIESPGPAVRAGLTWWVRRVLRRELGNYRGFIEWLGQEVGAWRGTIRGGHVQPREPEPPRSRVPHWPVG